MNEETKQPAPETAASCETNPTLPTATESANKAVEAPPEGPQSMPAPSAPKKHRLKAFLGYVAKVVGAVFATGSTLLFLVALWDSYRPKITVTPGAVLDPQNPFATTFIIQNQGALKVRNVSFDTTWIYADDTNQARNVSIGINVIPELEPLEQHTLMGLLPTVGGTNPIAIKSDSAPPSFVHHALIFWFSVTYEPQFFTKKTTEIYFFGIWDSNTNFQWLPTGHEDIRLENSPDAALLKNARDFYASIDRQKAFNATNNIAKPHK
jgi:hypothetical protein